jgi:hypothetical protein
MMRSFLAAILSSMIVSVPALAEPRASIFIPYLIQPDPYVGHCPIELRFRGRISDSAGTYQEGVLLPVLSKVDYRWRRSDGVVGPVMRVVFLAPGGSPVSFTWHAGTPGAKYGGWVVIEIVRSGSVVATSNRARFSLACNPLKPLPPATTGR